MPPQASTSINEDVAKEVKTQSGVGVQGGPDKDCEMVVEGRVILEDQIENGDCPQTNSIDGKSVEYVEKKTGGNVSPSNGNIGSIDNHVVHTSSSCRAERDLENQPEPDTCHKVAETHRAAGQMENTENNDVSSNTQNSKFVEFWVPVQISNVQLEQYCATLISNASALCSSSKSDTFGAFNNMYIANRKCCNHPYIVNKALHGSLIKYKGQSTVLDVDIKASGKLQFLDHVLPEIRKQQLKVLIVFQPTSGTLKDCLSLGQILVDYFDQRYGQNSFEHFDGSGKPSTKKQAAINMFNKEPDRFIFFLESRSCNHSIKLSVDIIIIFDSELNPSNDLKSLQKLSINSRLGQVLIFRLYTSSTLEEKILKLAENNIAIDLRSRCSFDILLTWGASDLFDKLTKFHSQTIISFSSEESLLKDVVEEFLDIIYHKGKSMDTTSKTHIIRAPNYGIYGKNILPHCEVKTYLTDGIQPYMFWGNLLEGVKGRSPVWKFVSESTPRQRKRPSFFTDSPPRVVRTRRKTVNIGNTVEPGKLNTVTEGETGGVNEGVPAANDESQSSSGDQYRSTSVDDETSLLDLLMPTVSQLCNILNFSEDVKMIVEKFLEFILSKYNVSKEYTSALHALMIALCWISSSLRKRKIDWSESFALAKKNLNFCCTEEEAKLVYEKLMNLEDTFLQETKILDCLKDSIPAREELQREVIKCQHIHNASAFENNDSCENVSKMGDEEFKTIRKIWDEKRASLEHEYNMYKFVILGVYNKSPAYRAEHLIKLERKFAKKLEEHERLKPTLLSDEGQVVAENESHSGNHPEVAPTKNPIEVQSLDEPVCEGDNDIESTGSHISEKETIDATLCSERIGEVPAQQVDDDMEVDVEEKVDSSHEDAKGGAGSPYVSHAVADPVVDCNETGANDMALDVDSADVESPAGDHSNVSDEDETIGLDTSLVVEGRHENVDDVPSEVECVEMGMPTGTHAVEGHNKTDVNCMSPHVDLGDMEKPPGNSNHENNEDGTAALDTSLVVEDHHEIVDDVAPEVECAETGMPAANYNKENNEDGIVDVDTSHVEDPHEVIDDVAPIVECAETEDIEDGEIRPDVGDNHKETGPNDVLPRAKSAEMEMPAGTHDKEDTEDGEITPDFGDDHNKIGPNDVIPHAESAETGAPAGTHDKEHAEDGEIIPDIPNVGDKHNEIGPCVKSADMATPADNEENIEDNIIMPDAVHANEACVGSCGSDDNNPVGAAALSPSVEQVSSPALDHLEPIIPEIQNELEVHEPSGTLQPSGENLEDNLAAVAVEAGHEVHEPSVAPAPLVNPLNMFDNITNRVTSQMPTHTDPLQAEVDRLKMVKASVTKFHEEMKQKLDFECEKEISEMIVQIRLKYDAKHVEVDTAYNKKAMELETNIDKVSMNRILAKAFRSKCQDLTSSGNTGMQQVSQAALMQQMCRAPSLGQSSGSQQPPQPYLPQPQPVPPPQTRSQPPLPQPQPVPPLQPPQTRSQSPLPQPQSVPPQTWPQPPLPQPQPVPLLQPPQTRPQPPLQVVLQSSALFSSRPSPVVSQVISSTPSTTSRPPPIINHMPPSTTTRPRPTSDPLTPPSAPTTSRPPPIINHIPSTTTRPRPTSDPITPSSAPTTSRPPPIISHSTPSSTPTNSRPLPGFNTINPSTVSNRSPLGIAQIDMSAANLRINTETRGQSPHMRPIVSGEPRAQTPPLASSEPRASSPHFRLMGSSEPRASSPHFRHLGSGESRAPAPHMRSSVNIEVRATAPHLRSGTPLPFRSIPLVSPDLGTHGMRLPGQHVTSIPSQPNVIPPPSTSSPPSLTPLPSEPVVVPPPSTEPSPSSQQTPLLAPDLVCLSDDD